jgi:hypothetical protein
MRSTERAMAQQLVFELDDVRVTPYIAQFGDTSYQIASIGSVRVLRVKKRNPVAVALFLLGVALFVAAIVRSSGNRELADANFPLAAIAVGTMFAAFLLQLVWPSRVFKLLLRTHSADVEALTSNRSQVVLDVKQTIETAFIARAQHQDQKANS